MTNARVVEFCGVKEVDVDVDVRTDEDVLQWFGHIVDHENVGLIR